MKAWILRCLGLSGTLLFGSLLAFTFHRPVWVEQAAKDFISRQVEEKVGAHVAAAVGTNEDFLARAADELHHRNEERIQRLQAALASRLHERVAVALGQIRDLDCSCRARIAALLETGLLASVQSLDAANARLTEFVQGKYLHVVRELTRDLRIFTLTNCLACLMLLFVSFARPRAIDHLIFPGVLLAVAVIVSSYCYVFAQNWFFTILYSDYFGYSYLAFLGCVFALLIDIFVNHGRVTTRLGNGLLHAAGSTFSLSIC